MRDAYEALRPRAFAIAYRMLGSVSEAEDVVQEALLRLHSAREEGRPIASVEGWLSTVVTRLAIDELRSARARRETYVGEWMPEPLVTNEEPDAQDRAEMADSLSIAFLVLLESLTPEQRAAFLLREVFDYGYDEIAGIVGRTEPAVRQLVSRARRIVRAGRPRFESRPEDAAELADRFFAAVHEGDLVALEDLLARDVTLHGDGGGKAPAIARPLEGRERIASVLMAWARSAERFGGAKIRRATINHAPGAIMLDPDDRIISVLVLEIVGGVVQTVRGIVNPDKLRHLGPVADVRALMKGRARSSES